MSFDVIGLTETWINETNKNLYSIKKYVHKESFRKVKRGGGVSLYVKEGLSFTEREDLSISNSHLESLFIELDSGKKLNNKTLIGVLYKPPSAAVDSFLEALSDVLSKVQTEQKESYIMGDYNMDLLKNKSNKQVSNFIDTFLSYSFLPLINKPTRITSSSATLIDNIFCNCVHNNNFLNGILCTDISDHLPIFCIKKTIQQNEEKVKYVKKRIFNDSSINKSRVLVNNIEWNNIIDITDCQQAFSKFQSHFTNCYEEAFPIVKMKLG